MSLDAQQLAELLEEQRPRKRPLFPPTASRFQHIINTGTLSQAASISATGLILEPPVGNSEVWELLAISSQVTASISVSDFLHHRLRNAIGLTSLRLARAILSQLAEDVLSWPSAQGDLNSTQLIPTRPIYAFRTPAGESWYRFEALLDTDASVGNREWNVTAMYRVVPREELR